MRYLIFTLLAFLFLSTSNAQESASLSGTIVNPTGKTVYLNMLKLVSGRNNLITLDSSNLDENGKYFLKTVVDSTTKIMFTDGNEVTELLLTPGDELNMDLNTRYFDETIQYSGKGAAKNNAIMVLYMLNEAFNNTLFTALENEDIDTTAIFSSYDDHVEEVGALINDYRSIIDDFASYGLSRLKQMETQKFQLKNYVRSQLEFKKFLASIEDKPAIDFKGIDLEGDTVSLSDYKGKVIVVDFWATWCGPCKAEFPAYKELEAKYGEDVHFVSVGVFCKEDDWRKMASDEGFQNNIFLSDKIQNQISPYRVNFIPRYLVIDENFNLIDGDAPRPSSGKLQAYWSN
jgi:thiol-disulfide isomerase/thioredoxin